MIASSPATRRKRRAETKVIASVREQVQARDGLCRLAGKEISECAGVSEWAHLASHRRSKTRKMDPVQRHDSKWTLMLCTRHHSMEERGLIRIECLTDAGCDGPIGIWDEDVNISTEGGRSPA